MAANTLNKQYTLVLNEEQRAELLRILENARVETHAELRRTEAPAYRDELHHEETVVQQLTAMVRKLT
jgi:uncharacterized protein (DUF1778 family)